MLSSTANQSCRPRDGGAVSPEAGRGPRLSGRLACWLMATLSLLFCGAVLLSAGSFYPPDAAPETVSDAKPERLLEGRNSPDQTALELLPGERIDLNTATAEELQKLPGIGEALSAAIVEDREQNGPFSAAEDLLRIPGIGEKRLEAIRDLISVEPED